MNKTFRSYRSAIAAVAYWSRRLGRIVYLVESNWVIGTDRYYIVTDELPTSNSRVIASRG